MASEPVSMLSVRSSLGLLLCLALGGVGFFGFPVVAVLAWCLVGWLVGARFKFLRPGLEPEQLEVPSTGVRPMLSKVAWIAALCSMVPLLMPLSQMPPEHQVASRLQKTYGHVWGNLAQQAESAAAALPNLTEASRAELFDVLARQAERGNGALNFLLFDATGEAQAWAGPGLLHEPQDMPLEGFSYRSSLTAVSLFKTVPVGDGPRPYHLVAGLSLSHAAWPFGGIPLDDGCQWWLGAPGNFDQGAASLQGVGELMEIPYDDAPSLYLAVDSLRLEPPPGSKILSTLGWCLWAVAWILVRRSDDLVAGPDGWVAWVRFVSVVLAALGLGQALGLNAPVSWSLAAAALVAVSGLLRYRAVEVRAALESPPLRGSGGALWRGLLATSCIVLVGVTLRLGLEAPDLATDLLGSTSGMALRLVSGLFGFGILCWAASHPGSAASGRWGWLSVVCLLLAAALHDHPAWSGLALLLGLVAAIRWASGERSRWRAKVLGSLLLMAALASSTAWELVHRHHVRQQLAEHYLSQIAPPTGDEVNDLLIVLQEHFASLEPSVTRSAGPGGDLQDLAYVLWRQSPLAASDGLSSLVVEPQLGQTSNFTFGLTLDAELNVVPDPSGWRVPPVPAWQRPMLLGEAVLGGPNAPWGTVRYAFLPRPGFRLAVSEVEELEAYLVQGEGQRKLIDGLPRSALYGLYDADGGAIASPWPEAPPLPAELLPSHVEAGRVATLSGASWFWKEEGDEGLRVLFLPILTPLEGLERVGTHALGSLLSMALLGLLLLTLMWPAATFQQVVVRSFDSYARRLLLVYTALLLLPLIALNLVLVRSFEQRLIDQQRANAQEAISSARVFLIDYLQGLDPGFGISTQIDRALMEWMTQVVQHQVNLYWNSRVYASSQQELFTAGLLPRRIPGEIFARLAYRGYEIGERRQAKKDDRSYLELYAPLDVPGLGLTDQGLFLSVPLLEQNKDVDRELATFRRRALLVTCGLFLLLVAVGSRLAKSFTKPIMTLIQGTERIAEGATSLPWRPREEELSSLAAAIDTMAGKLAEGRRHLLREKELVERIIENTTSGVVSVDQQRRVLLHNRRAAELLGTTVGRPLLTSIDASPHLDPLGELLRRPDDREWQATLKLRSGQGDEPRDWNLMWLPLPGDDPSALLLVDDVTEVLRGQRLSAWAEMARIIAHEIKNPLTPIRLSTEHMQMVYREDREHFSPVFERCTDNILRQVEELRDIASDFSIYSRIPKAELVEDDLTVALNELLAGYGDSARTLGTEICAAVPSGPLELRFDRKLLGRALRNLIENALRATGGQGVVELDVQRREEALFLSVGDRGPGVDEDNLERIFEPYFSTHESGTGLGLAITRRIVEEHGGRITAQNRDGGGLMVTISLPMKEQDSAVMPGTVEAALAEGAALTEGEDRNHGAGSSADSGADES